MSKYLFKSWGLTSLTLLALSGVAQAKVPDISGSYDIKAADLNEVDAKPGCIEHWRLHRNGSLLVDSDQEQVQGRWRVSNRDKTVLQLEWTDQTSNGLPDCWGHVAEKAIPDVEILFYLNTLSGLVLVKPDPNLDGAYKLGQLATRVLTDK